jgi:mono/diheme cytochrome c family protein
MADRRRGKGAAPPDWQVWAVAAVVVVAASVLMAVLVIPAVTDGDNASDGEDLTSAELYTRHCSACHGINGQGAIGPQLGGGAVAAAYPEIADEIDVIVEGRGSMPPFGDSLTDDEIRRIAEYTRTRLSGTPPTTEVSSP